MTETELVLEARNIMRTYPGEQPVQALKPTDIKFFRGEFAAIIGKSGSGKSTLLRILATLDRPDSGELIIEQKAVNQLSDARLAQFRRQRIGYIYQDYNLFPEYTAYENVVLPIHLDGRTPDPDRTMSLMERLGIAGLRNRFPHQLSGGEQQRISIARALITEPAVVFADEPTGNLDMENAERVADLLRLCSDELRQTVVMVTHDQGMANYADRMIRISDGYVTEN